MQRQQVDRALRDSMLHLAATPRIIAIAQAAFAELRRAKGTARSTRITAGCSHVAVRRPNACAFVARRLRRPQGRSYTSERYMT